MKLNVLFLRKRYIYYGTLLILIFVLLILFLLSKNTSYIFSTSNDKKSIQNYDLTGDGLKDSIYILNNKNQYEINVTSKEKNYILKSKNELNNLGNHYTYWPLRLTLLDASRDKLPEIFVQASKDGSPIQNVFMWKNNKFQNIINNSNNLLGFIDYHNNKTPKIILGNLNNKTAELSNYIISKNNLIKYPSNYNSNFLGKDSILEFIKYIDSLPYNILYSPREVFYPEAANSITKTVDTLSSFNATYYFQDGFFIDNGCDKDGVITSMKWILNFKGISNSDTKIVKNYTLNLILKPSGDTNSSYYFKIFYADFITQDNSSALYLP
ncbi:hypothetical protein [Clostridium akagii]|uniref:hypothetical protein n=1 Tax=Clostridium akagii TaxID=91623 RepID=UPI000478F1AA|nr:hypothetical protein [Clostridium akagii]